MLLNTLLNSLPCYRLILAASCPVHWRYGEQLSPLYYHVFYLVKTISEPAVCPPPLPTLNNLLF